MARITFVYPDHESLGLEYLMAVCLRDGHETDLVYYQIEDPYFGKRNPTIPFERLAEEVLDTRPDIVAFSCVTDNYRAQLGIAKALKKVSPGSMTIFGGVHVTALPEKVLAHEQVDCVAIGEAEISFPAFLRACQTGRSFTLPDKATKGIVFKSNGSTVGHFQMSDRVNLDDLPFADKSLYYTRANQSSDGYTLITSRGCPYQCAYCFNSFYYDPKDRHFIRQRSVDNVIAELKIARKQFGPRYILFEDDCFTTNAQWLRTFCEHYRKEINLPFTCITNPHFLEKSKIDALREAGCSYIHIGVQSLDEEICRTVLNRKSNNARIAQVIQDLRDVGIIVQIDHMLGIPGDTVQKQRESLLFYNRHRPSLISVYWLTYYPKTAIIDLASQRGILDETDVSKIEEGRRITRETYMSGGDYSEPERFYSFAFLMRYLPLLPRFLVSFLVRTGLYRVFRINSYFLSIAIPRIIQSFLDPQDLRGREHMLRFIKRNLRIPMKEGKKPS